MIDNDNLPEAEAELTNTFKLSNNRLEIDEHQELIYLPSNKIKNMKKLYNNIQSKYAGSYRELIMRMDMLKKDHALEIQEEKSRNDLKDEIIKQKDLIIEIERMKNMLLRNNISI
jgi:hypothetical protein